MPDPPDEPDASAGEPIMTGRIPADGRGIEPRPSGVPFRA